MADEIRILNSKPDKEVYWSGSQVKELGIEKNMSYDQALLNFTKAFLDLYQAKFNIGSLGNDIATRDETINLLVGKVNALATGDIAHNGIPFNNNKLSVEASKFLGTKFNYSVVSDSNGAKLDINIKEQLPSDVLSTRIVVSGKSTNGKNIFMDTSEKITSVVLKNEMYPIDIDVNVRTQTTGGIVDLEKKVVLHNPSEIGSFQSTYDIKDRSYNAPFSGKLSDWLGGIEATQDRLEQYHDVLKNTSKGDIVNTVNGHDYMIDSLSKEVDGMKTMTVMVTNPTGTVTTKTVTPQEAVNILANQVNNLLSDNTSLKTDLKAVQNQLSNVSNPSGGGIDGTLATPNVSLSSSVV